MGTCVFCGIVEGSVPAKFVYQDDQIAVFSSIEPKAEVHLIIIPKKHMENLEELEDEVFLKIRDQAMELVGKLELNKKGYRLVTNGGAAKAVAHLHFHLLGGIKAERVV